MRNLMPRTGLRPDERLGHQSVDEKALFGAICHHQPDVAISLLIVTADDAASLARPARCDAA
jgi:hypothetical protein